MQRLETVQQELKHLFKDNTILGNFISNHDNPRFLYELPDNQHFVYKNAIIYSMLAEGIPIFYYGDEQNFNGGPDPYCREPLFDKKNKS